jgi:Uma2 family endonuclease
VANPNPAAPPVRGEPAWGIAQLFPPQGEWSEADYLHLQTNHLIEFSEGCVEFLPMPTHLHQMIVAFLYGLLKSFVDAHDPGGVVLFAPLPVRLWPGKFREPDLLYMGSDHRSRIHQYWDGADLVIEVISESNQDHDRETKRIEYALAGIPEYWIVDPINRQIIVHTLDDKTYRQAGVHGPGSTAESILLKGWAVHVDSMLDLVDQP